MYAVGTNVNFWRPNHLELLQQVRLNKVSGRRRNLLIPRSSSNKSQGDDFEISNSLEHLFREPKRNEGLSAFQHSRERPKEPGRRSVSGDFVDQEGNDADYEDNTRSKVKKFVDMALFPVEWALLPGSTDLLHIFMPHCVHMFETIISGPKPWKYCHLYTATQSKNDTEGAIGTLAEIVKVKHFSDGRLLILSKAIKRMRVTGLIQSVPYKTVTTEALQDEEEIWTKTLPDEVGARYDVAEKDMRAAKLMSAIATYKLRQREREFWSTYDSSRHLAGKLRLDETMQPPPPSLAKLLPPKRGAGEEEDARVVIHRVQDLSFASAATIPDLPRGSGRQELLEAPSVCARLQIITEALLERRSELAARVAVKDVLDIS